LKNKSNNLAGNQILDLEEFVVVSFALRFHRVVVRITKGMTVPWKLQQATKFQVPQWKTVLFLSSTEAAILSPLYTCMHARSVPTTGIPL
jgi:hypothetical protein